MTKIAKAATDSGPIGRISARLRIATKTSTIRVLGMTFSGRPLLEETTRKPVAHGA